MHEPLPLKTKKLWSRVYRDPDGLYFRKKFERKWSKTWRIIDAITNQLQLQSSNYNFAKNREKIIENAKNWRNYKSKCETGAVRFLKLNLGAV